MFRGPHKCDGYVFELAGGELKAVIVAFGPGIGDECKNQGLYEFTQLLINMSGAVGFCM